MKLSKWAQAVKERDGWRCKECGATDNLHAHHIKPRALGGKNVLDNGETLCVDCHREEHAENPVQQKSYMHPQFFQLFVHTQLRLVTAGEINRLTFKYISDETGIDYQRIRDYARGHVKQYNVKHLARLCQFFHCQPADLIVLNR